MTEQQKSRRGCRRWLVRIAGAMAVLLIALRIALPFAVPFALEKAAAAYGLDASLEDADFVVLGGYVSLRELELRPQDAPEDTPPLARTSSAVVDVDLSALFTGTLRIHRIEVDELEVWAERDEEGTWSFERHLPAQAEQDDPQPEPEPEPEAAPTNRASRTSGCRSSWEACASSTSSCTWRIER